MKAAAIHSHGGPENLSIVELPEPQAGPGEVVLEVRAAALNHLDIWVRKGRPGMQLPMPHVLGSDASGIVSDLGPGSGDQFQPGDEVILNPGLWDPECEFSLRGEPNVSPSFSIVGLSRPGTFAQKVAVPAYCVQPKPAYLSFTEAAALPLVYLTAWRMLMTRAALRMGETVLIHGIGGGVALAGLQWAKLGGAVVIATSSSDNKLERAKALGADHGINYRATQSVADAVRGITRGRGVDVVFDTVGAATWPINLASVRKGGRIVHCGITTGASVEADLRTLYWNQLTIMGSTMGSPEDFRLMLRSAETARLKPVIDSIHPLKNAKEAMDIMESGKQFGKIVLEMV